MYIGIFICVRILTSIQYSTKAEYYNTYPRIHEYAGAEQRGKIRYESEEHTTHVISYAHTLYLVEPSRLHDIVSRLVSVSI